MIRGEGRVIGKDAYTVFRFLQLGQSLCSFVFPSTCRTCLGVVAPVLGVDLPRFVEAWEVFFPGWLSGLSGLCLVFSGFGSWFPGYFGLWLSGYSLVSGFWFLVDFERFILHFSAGLLLCSFSFFLHFRVVF